MKCRISNGLKTALTLVAALWTLSHAHAADELALSGKDLFARNCASCHGPQALGDGPVAPYLTIKVPNLRHIADRNGGKFPADKVEQVIDGRAVVGAHGTRDMPIWGEHFMRRELGNEDAQRATMLLVKRLTDYLQSIQQKSTASNSK